MGRSALARRYGRARSPEADVARWLANARDWWARAEQEAPKELAAYRRVRKANVAESVKRAALERLKEALR
jgi:hypothetical protein